MDYHAKGLCDEEFMSHDWGSIYIQYQVVLLFIPFYSAKVSKGMVTFCSSMATSLCHLINMSDESMPDLNRLLTTLFMPHCLNITSDIFVMWLLSSISLWMGLAILHTVPYTGFQHQIFLLTVIYYGVQYLYCILIIKFLGLAAYVQYSTEVVRD